MRAIAHDCLGMGQAHTTPGQGGRAGRKERQDLHRHDMRGVHRHDRLHVLLHEGAQYGTRTGLAAVAPGHDRLDAAVAGQVETSGKTSIAMICEGWHLKSTFSNILQALQRHISPNGQQGWHDHALKAINEHQGWNDHAKPYK